MDREAASMQTWASPGMGDPRENRRCRRCLVVLESKGVNSARLLRLRG